MPVKDETRKMAKLYNQGWTLAEIGSKFGLTRQGVRYRLMAAGIERRAPSKSKKRIEIEIDKNLLEKLYSRDRLIIKDIAAAFSVTERIIREALEFYTIPRRRPLPLDGRHVDLLRALRIDEKKLIEWHQPSSYPAVHRAAQKLGMRISLKSEGDGKFTVTRLA